MSVPVPYSLPSTSAWALADWLDHPYTSPPAANGTATITLDALDDLTRWRLTHAVVGCVSAAGAALPAQSRRLRLYNGSVANPYLRDGSTRGEFDVADWALGLWIPPGGQLVAVWSGCSDGDIATLNLQAEIYRRSS